MTTGTQVLRATMDEQFDSGPRVLLVEHIIRPGWDGPGKIQGFCWDGIEEAKRRLATLKPEDEAAVAVRPYDQVAKIWMDTGEPAWNPKVHKKS